MVCSRVLESVRVLQSLYLAACSIIADIFMFEYFQWQEGQLCLLISSYSESKYVESDELSRRCGCI